ncbi:DNA phosphorothioation system sulfurtransferase DndC [Salmonella enterica subsp. enterica serovar Hull]|uniref:DNA phosphorothioation system sulfurtransferase DndC n=1 Tax=Salmonella enterica subsp. enterica serovar Hull TaxID=1403564 RepID=A0A5H8NHT5_SALET|nr:DNA phosphorothioation system sulfurtransferase DndC [Salmonella enterica]EAA4687854.1 DNA phosphorothioation system sulfurtransferase DndC [Salmonella enterica subsp. enterica serovar Hull]ECJ4973537.1 DNA phosphorothioation system sulfurtransferase DndC [Salmonella enterica subsp. enterica]EAQ6426316.1 DNA phosphorothioation system sulfurtransferase DndC [Salmonella enterica]EAY5227623.1 DNA phosphorothioation system sulfurtransferase DndC [Salmonella enterica]EBA4497955.1 DNA phosphoroth
MSQLQQVYDLEVYEDFINQENFAGRPLSDFISEIQRVYLADKRPWVIGYSGGKDSSAVTTLIYLALLGLSPDQREKPVFVVCSDTLVETPVVVDLISRTMKLIEKGAERDNLPITVQQVIPKVNETFWVNLLGKGYPAPTRQFRWCTERMKINPVSDFIRDKVSQYDEVIVVLGSRSAESSSRAQVIAKHKIDGTRLARHTTLSNAFIYTPIDTWSVDDVWKLLRGAFRYSPDDVEEWENPWGGNNRPLWTLYMDSSGQGECPMVIDDSTPSCGNSRFGCWTCTVVTKDRAMESLVQNGEQWMTPLLEFRNMLANTTDPAQKDKYRNYKRRTGKVSYQNAKEGEDISADRKHVPGPYWLSYRKMWLEQLLNLEKSLNAEGHEIKLITEGELHAIRQEWLKDPNEPDWKDSLPEIYRRVYGQDLNWLLDERVRFAGADAGLLVDLANDHGVVPEMIMKLIELEISFEGMGRRQNVQKKIDSILQQDWGTFEEIQEKHAGIQKKNQFDVLLSEKENIENSLKELSNDIEKLEQVLADVTSKEVHE